MITTSSLPSGTSFRTNESFFEQTLAYKFGGKELAIAAYIAFLYAIGMLLLSGMTLDCVFRPTPYHRIQADALMAGHMSLSESIEAVQYDTAWCNGKVQQIWGLGPALWTALFQGPGKLVGISPFPDTIPFGAAYLLLAFYTISTGMSAGRNRWIFGLGFILLVLFAPPLWTLTAKGPQTVYDDGSVYAIIVSSALLVGLIRVLKWNRLTDFWICSILAGLTGLVRPPHGVFGLLAVVLAFAVLWSRGRSKAHLAAGVGVYGLFVIFLFWSNAIRFGSPLEFGHTFTQTDPNTILTSRFFNPLKKASLIAACKELFGALFFALGDIRTKTDYGTGLFPWQTPFLRWRNWYITTYDPSMLVLLLFGAAVVGARLFKAAKAFGACTLIYPLKSDSAIFIWSMVSCLAIFIFLLYFPFLCARYLYDFWPGFLGIVLIAWESAARYRPKVAGLILIVWLGSQLWRADCRFPRQRYLSASEAPQELPTATGVHMSDFNGRYDFDHHPFKLKFPIYWSHWDEKTGLADHTIQFPVDRAEFIEIKVGDRVQGAGVSERKDLYRVRIQDHELKPVSTKRDSDGVTTVRFEMPLEYQAKDHFVFLTFIAFADKEDMESRRPLYSVRWR